MFDLFRSQKQVVRWLLGAILMLVAASMVITLVPGLFSGASVNMNDPVLVEVGDQVVTTMDLQNRLRDYQMTGQIPAESIAFLARQSIEALITEEVLLVEANRLGLMPTEEELAERIRSQLSFLFEQGGGIDAYRTFIRQRFQRSVAEFEDQVMLDLVVNMRLKRLVTDNVVVSEDELRDSYKLQNDRIQVEYLTVPTTSMTSKVQPDEEKTKAYFEQNQSRYATQELRSVKVLRIQPAEIEAPEISDAEMRAFYDRNLARYQVDERVQASHILLMTLDKPEEEVKEIEARANELLEKVESGADFAELAKQHSEDPGTKDQGGDLGWVTRGQMVPAFEEATFALEPGEHSGVVKTEYGYHIIQVHDRDYEHTQTFDEVKEQIRQDLSQEQQQLARMQKLDQAVGVAQKHGRDLEAAGEELGLPVQSYENFPRINVPPELPTAPEFVTAVFSASEGEVLTQATDDGTLVAVVTSITPTQTPDFEDVRERVTRDWTMSEAAELARQRAQEIATAAREANDLGQVAAKNDLTVQTSEFITRAEEIQGLGSAQSLGNEAFTAEAGAIVGPVTTAAGPTVLRVVNRQAADMAQFAAQREELRQQMTEAKRNQMYEIYKGITRRRYEDRGEIERHQPRIDALIQQYGRTG